MARPEATACAHDRMNQQPDTVAAAMYDPPAPLRTFTSVVELLPEGWRRW